ncbi:uncharacterized protein SCHCODRAFT_01316236 [Schizophyllum commune H4-8]|uniref:uncharacterized protein n=1 Tax=Schizophyllum commune (strain H4-8 / FGSC 9210) TaxID=578458 RepID=UPI00215F50E6|nr:uncharacterized protein SCHCODRAFT_01316236 [Schizophyllum commune H4-8]KAI5890203.1 hypothetical protein SCHCODRAFT_01316236 [Schizophyllum commune H4-8]
MFDLEKGFEGCRYMHKSKKAGVKKRNSVHSRPVAEYTICNTDFPARVSHTNRLQKNTEHAAL